MTARIGFESNEIGSRRVKSVLMHRLTGCSIAGVVATGVLLWGTAIPLGIPGEWTWPRLPVDPQTGGSLLLAGILAACYVGFCRVGHQRMGRPNVTAVEVFGWLTGLTLAAAFWIWNVQETAPPAAQFAKLPFVLYYPSSSGYFHRVRYVEPDPVALLKGYEALMAEEDHLHVGTHPPGLFLVFHGLRAFQQQFPNFVTAIDRWTPQSYRDALEIVLENTARTNQPALAADGVTMWLAGLLAFVCAVLTIWPLFVIATWFLSREGAWTVAAMWPTLPAVAMFLPKSDAAFPFLSCLLIAVAVGGWRRQSWGLGLLAGWLWWMSWMTSLAFVPVVAFGGLWILFDAGRQIWQTPVGWSIVWRKLLPYVALVLLGFVLPILWLWGQYQINMVTVWGWNYQNHAGFYQDFTRTWWKWLLVNPLELALAVGWPCAVFAVAGVLDRRYWRRPWSMANLGRVVGLTLAALLWISGKNSGEAARLWLLFFPAVVVLAGQGWERIPSPSAESQPQSASPPSSPALWLTLQLIAAILTVHRVGGFHLATP